MKIEFREFNPFDCWIWVEFTTVPAPLERQYLEELFDSWFFLGKLGGFNAENLQAQEEGLELSYMPYQAESERSSLPALMHNMSEVEYQGCWARCWFDLGTSDAIALDVLLNSMQRLSDEMVTVERVLIGGENEDWPTPGRRNLDFTDDWN